MNCFLLWVRLWLKGPLKLKALNKVCFADLMDENFIKHFHTPGSSLMLSSLSEIHLFQPF